jgi:hypothetical protein
MHDVIEVDFAAAWRVPVFVRGSEGKVYTVRGPEDALRCLQEIGVSYQGTAQMIARSKCIAAVMRNATCDDAREAFVDACFETGSLI